LNATGGKYKTEKLNKSDVKYPKYEIMNWTVCYNDNYFIYIDNNKNSE